jgi:hypothetical protein
VKASVEWTVPWNEVQERLGRQLVGRWKWQPFGPDGICGTSVDMTCIVSCAPHDGADWIHASVARQDRLPSYFDLTALHKAVWGETGFAFQIFASSDRHVSIHDKALHLWGRADGANPLPDFGSKGTI